jgi:pyruvate/2-oxoacid:ferredoxin oxidoreductase alpha subunit
MISGMNFYAAYPMTPASSLIDVITEGFQKINQRISDDEKNLQKSSEKSSAIFYQ